MGQERLNNLSIEHEVAHDLNYTDVTVLIRLQLQKLAKLCFEL